MIRAPFVFILRPWAIDYARDKLLIEEAERAGTATYGRALYALARDPNTRVSQVTALLANLPPDALLTEVRTPPRMVKRRATMTDLAQALSVSRDLLYANLRGKPLSVRMRRRILTCCAFAELTEEQIWEKRDRVEARASCGDGDERSV